MPACIHVTVTVAANPQANPTAYAINTGNASLVTVPAGVGQGTMALGASRTSKLVNRSLILAAEARNARSQPRNVETVRPHPAAIVRWPQPNAAFASIAAAITSAVSAHRAADRASSSTCVRCQVLHRDRRGRSRRLTQ